MEYFIFKLFGKTNCVVVETVTGKRWQQYTILNLWFYDHPLSDSNLTNNNNN